MATNKLAIEINDAKDDIRKLVLYTQNIPGRGLQLIGTYAHNVPEVLPRRRNSNSNSITASRTAAGITAAIASGFEPQTKNTASAITAAAVAAGVVVSAPPNIERTPTIQERIAAAAAAIYSKQPSQPTEENTRADKYLRRKEQLEKRMAEIATTNQYSSGIQAATNTHHRAKALVSVTGYTQKFIASHTGICNSQISLYLRRCLSGRKETIDEIERLLEEFIEKYLRGEFDGY